MREFRLTSEHLKLLQRSYWGWNDCEFGAPEMDPKRPYGNKNVIRDMAKILKWPDFNDEDEEVSADANFKLGELHRELETAIEIIFRTLSFMPGLYRADEYKSNWRRVSD